MSYFLMLFVDVYHSTIAANSNPFSSLKSKLLLPSTVTFLSMLLSLLCQGEAFAYSSYVAAFANQYQASYQTVHPGQSLTIANCALCHINPSGGGARNSYGNAIGQYGSFTAVESLDSDGDGFSNLAEIMALPETYPGNAASHPAPTTTTIATSTTTSTTTTTLPPTTTSTSTTSTTTTTIPANSIVTLTSGWNLVGLGLNNGQPLDVTELGNVISVWKWTTVNNTKTWAVYLPGETISGAYATSKGFGQFTTIEPNEGFWVNIQ